MSRIVGSLVLPAGALLLVGWLDYVTGPLLTFSPFYLLVLVLTALRRQWPAALAYGVLAAAVSLTVDVLTTPALAGTIYPYWQALAQLIVFAGVTVMIPMFVRERERLAESRRTLVGQRAELHDLNRRLVLALGELTAAKDRAVNVLVAQHTATVRELQGELERGLNVFRALRSELGNLHDNHHAPTGARTPYGAAS
jgi:hypothetical protein